MESAVVRASPGGFVVRGRACGRRRTDRQRIAGSYGDYNRSSGMSAVGPPSRRSSIYRRDRNPRPVWVGEARRQSFRNQRLPKACSVRRPNFDVR